MHRSLTDKASVVKLGELGSNPSGASLSRNRHIPSVIAYACTQFDVMCGIPARRLQEYVLSRDGIIVALGGFSQG